jgi:hypothetical protein
LRCNGTELADASAENVISRTWLAGTHATQSGDKGSVNQLELPMWLLVNLIIGVTLFLLVEFLYPTRKDDPLTARQRHFWATVMFALTFVLGMVVEQFRGLDERVERIASVFHGLTSPDLERRFNDLYQLSYQRISPADPRIRRWYTSALDSFIESITRGRVPIPREIVAREIGKLYPSSRDHIVATNVGKTDFFFEGRSGAVYIDNNRSALTRHVPVIRFYILNVAAQRENWKEDLKNLHERLGTVKSVVIDVANVTPARDLILFDGLLVAESDLTPESYANLGAWASAETETVGDARDYLVRLSTIKTEVVFRASNGFVDDNFPQFRGIPSKPIATVPETETRAEMIAERILHQVSQDN